MWDAPMTWLVTFPEIVADLGKTPGATRFWLHAHGVRATRRVGVGERGTRGVYDGEAVTRHAARQVQDCPACGHQRRDLSCFVSGTVVSAKSQPHGQ
jgi:hypothetical protein